MLYREFYLLQSKKNDSLTLLTVLPHYRKFCFSLKSVCKYAATLGARLWLGRLLTRSHSVRVLVIVVFVLHNGRKPLH